jgi:4-hydroxy-tetrahydrodipicolinate reductase
LSAAVATAAIRTVLIGATGRMGLNILRLLPRFPALQLCGAVVPEHSKAIGEDALAQGGTPGAAGSAAAGGTAGAGVKLSAALPPLLASADLAIDFSNASATAANLAACVAAGVPLLIGTTGLPRELQAPLAAAGERIAVLVAPNTSPGLNLLLALVREAARALPTAYDIEILEAHHRNKADSPSGTALALGQAAAQGRGVTFDEHAVYARHGLTGARAAGQIGFSAVRGGDVVGEHEVMFLGEGERLVLRHEVTDRSVFARGALIAGQWLARKPAGRYEMSDVFISKNN